MWRRLWSVIPLLWAAQLTAQSPARTEGEVPAILQRHTQELLDAVTTGSPAVWERYLDSAMTYTTEDGTMLGKADMVAQIKPLPRGVSGNLKVTDFKVALHGPVAIATHVDDEHENYHGHPLHCQYRTTDTWMKTPAGWRLIASQVLALRTDPPALPLSAQQMAEYVGRYQLTPEISYEIRREGNGLVGRETGRKTEILRAETRDVLFVPGRPRYRMVFRRGADGRIADFAERREAWDLVWTRN
jgi:ketosteroid isomerase-like protein